MSCSCPATTAPDNNNNSNKKSHVQVDVQKKLHGPGLVDAPQLRVHARNEAVNLALQNHALSRLRSREAHLDGVIAMTAKKKKNVKKMKVRNKTKHK